VSLALATKKKMHLSSLLLVAALLFPSLCAAEDINISKCEDSVKRQIYLSKDFVAVVRTYHGPAAAILLARSTPEEVDYVWRYRESEKGATTTDRETFRAAAAKDRARIEKPFMDVGSFIIEWNLAATPVSSLFYCPTLALVLYYPKSEFEKLPRSD
jgi:hypothetical protein